MLITAASAMHIVLIVLVCGVLFVLAIVRLNHQRRRRGR
jgi:hypothetical protein